MPPRKSKRLEPITIRFEAETRRDLDKLASDLGLPLAWLVNLALRQWLAGRGLDRANLAGLE